MQGLRRGGTIAARRHSGLKAALQPGAVLPPARDNRSWDDTLPQRIFSGQKK
jgi:hypothetical protein